MVATELAEMIEWLVEELALIGLHLNASKTNILCTSEGTIELLDVVDTLMEVSSGNECCTLEESCLGICKIEVGQHVNISNTSSLLQFSQISKSAG